MSESLNLADFGVDADRFTEIRLVTRDSFGSIVSVLDSKSESQAFIRLLDVQIDKADFDKCMADTNKDDFLTECSMISDRAILTSTDGYERLSDLNKLEDDILLPLAEFESLGIIGAILPALLKAEESDQLVFNVKPNNVYVKEILKGRPSAGQCSHQLKIGEPYQHILFTRDATTCTDRYAPKDYINDKENRLAFGLGCLMHHLAFGDAEIEGQKENNNISYLYSHYMFNLLKVSSKERQSLVHFERSLRTLKDCEALVIYPTAKVVNLMVAKGKYSGSMKYGLMHGYGSFESTKEIFTMLEVSKYEGYFCLDKMHGSGKVLYRSGDTYTGQLQWDQPKGWGSMVRISGTRLTGYWEGSQLNEDHEAEIEIPDFSSYKGMSCKNIPNGYGTMEYSDGFVYQGDFKQNTRHGKGTMTKEVDGNQMYRYDGQWHENEKHGEGIETVPDQYEYQGNFHMGKRQGQGKLWNKPDGFNYEGEFRSDKFHGFGQLELESGERFSGQFKNGVRDGFGCSDYRDGSAYEGQWENDKQHGEGALISSNGNVVSGVWVEGEQLKDEHLK